jgi:hypothetical protein
MQGWEVKKVSYKTLSCPRRTCGPSSRWASSRRSNMAKMRAVLLDRSLGFTTRAPPSQQLSNAVPEVRYREGSPEPDTAGRVSAGSDLFRHPMEMGIPQVSSGCLPVMHLPQLYAFFHRRPSWRTRRELRFWIAEPTAAKYVLSRHSAADFKLHQYWPSRQPPNSVPAVNAYR